MDILAGFTPLFIAGIFLIGFLALLLTGFNTLLNAKIEPLKDSFDAKIEPLKDNQARFDSELKEIKAKLDQLLAKVSR